MPDLYGYNEDEQKLVQRVQDRLVLSASSYSIAAPYRVPIPEIRCFSNARSSPLIYCCTICIYQKATHHQFGTVKTLAFNFINVCIAVCVCVYCLLMMNCDERAPQLYSDHFKIIAAHNGINCILIHWWVCPHTSISPPVSLYAYALLLCICSSFSAQFAFNIYSH